MCEAALKKESPKSHNISYQYIHFLSEYTEMKYYAVIKRFSTVIVFNCNNSNVAPEQNLIQIDSIFSVDNFTSAVSISYVVSQYVFTFRYGAANS